MALFDSKSALNHAIKYLSDAAIKRNAGGWVPPKERAKQEHAQQKQFIADEKERRKNLADWHKGSHPETLNPDGTPRVFYHGTGGDFSVFNPEHRSDAVRSIFLSHTPEFANQFATEDYPSKKGKDANIMPVYVSTKNPFDYKNIEHINQVLKNLRNNKDFMEDYGADFADYAKGIAEGNWQYIENPWVQDAIQNRHDGFFAQGNGHRFLSVYSPHQIKSATGNQGTFDPSNPDITKSEGGPILSKQFPTQYMPNVGRQVMADGGTPDDLNKVGLYSKASRIAAALPQKKATGAQMVAALKDPKRGVKKEELINAGLMTHEGAVHPDWADRSVTTDELAQHFRDQMPQIEERILGRQETGYGHKTSDEWNEAVAQAELAGNWDEANRLQEAWEKSEAAPTKYHNYTLPGGENYREVLLKLPHEKKQRVGVTSTGHIFTEEELSNPIVRKTAEKIGLTMEDRMMPIMQPFKSQHWDDPNVLAHIRMSDRTGPNGEKILHVEELQSDWGQKGKKSGFKESNNNEEQLSNQIRDLMDQQARKYSELINDGSASVTSVYDHPEYKEINDKANDLRDQLLKMRESVPSAPYVTSTEGWTDLALKRVLKEAAEGGYDKIVWTPGAEQAKRYDLSKQISELELVHNKNGEGKLTFVDKNLIPHQQDVKNPEHLAELVGKDLAEKLYEKSKENNGMARLTGLDLKVGGEGMKGYYDKIVPSRLQALAKKHDPNAKIGVSDALSRGRFDLPLVHENLPSLDVTPQMRESIMKGQEAYKRGGTVSKKHPALSIAGTHIREEEHGEPIFTGRL